ncbi:hypothetical protein CDD81_7996 [Ophiocordyceps australis]|uniref:Uncharacterized protein n=1 Tax=Ophiocordyceps australis TaxID=1399860 RepID=A0A2C5X8U1_9HYPO|nr:hypothetical protein CDD81_7996 [Ophiocordyceps australis]
MESKPTASEPLGVGQAFPEPEHGPEDPTMLDEPEATIGTRQFTPRRKIAQLMSMFEPEQSHSDRRFEKPGSPNKMRQLEPTESNSVAMPKPVMSEFRSVETLPTTKTDSSEQLERSPSPQPLMTMSSLLGEESTAHIKDAASDAQSMADSLHSNVESDSPKGDLDISTKFEPSWRPDLGSNQSTSWDASGPFFEEKPREEREPSEKAPITEDDNMTTRPDSIFGWKPTADTERSISPELAPAERNFTSPSPSSDAYKRAAEKASVVEPEPTSTLHDMDQVKAQLGRDAPTDSTILTSFNTSPDEQVYPTIATAPESKPFSENIKTNSDDEGDTGETETPKATSPTRLEASPSSRYHRDFGEHTKTMAAESPLHDSTVPEFTTFADAPVEREPLVEKSLVAMPEAAATLDASTKSTWEASQPELADYSDNLPLTIPDPEAEADLADVPRAFPVKAQIAEPLPEKEMLDEQNATPTLDSEKHDMDLAQPPSQREALSKEKEVEVAYPRDLDEELAVNVDTESEVITEPGRVKPIVDAFPEAPVEEEQPLETVEEADLGSKRTLPFEAAEPFVDDAETRNPFLDHQDFDFDEEPKAVVAERDVEDTTPRRADSLGEEEPKERDVFMEEPLAAYEADAQDSAKDEPFHLPDDKAQSYIIPDTLEKEDAIPGHVASTVDKTSHQPMASALDDETMHEAESRNLATDEPPSPIYERPVTIPEILASDSSAEKDASPEKENLKATDVADPESLFKETRLQTMPVQDDAIDNNALQRHPKQWRAENSSQSQPFLHLLLDMSKTLLRLQYR